MTTFPNSLKRRKTRIDSAAQGINNTSDPKKFPQEGAIAKPLVQLLSSLDILFKNIVLKVVVLTVFKIFLIVDIFLIFLIIVDIV